MKVIIVGGVAGGASCAARLRRLEEKAEGGGGGAALTCPTQTAGCLIIFEVAFIEKKSSLPGRERAAVSRAVRHQSQDQLRGHRDFAEGEKGQAAQREDRRGYRAELRQAGSVARGGDVHPPAFAGYRPPSGIMRFAPCLVSGRSRNGSRDAAPQIRRCAPLSSAAVSSVWR